MRNGIGFNAKSLICICVVFFALSNYVLAADSAMNSEGYFKFGDNLAVRATNGTSVVNLPGISIDQENGKLIIRAASTATVELEGAQSWDFKEIVISPQTRQPADFSDCKHYTFPGLTVYYPVDSNPAVDFSGSNAILLMNMGDEDTGIGDLLQFGVSDIAITCDGEFVINAESDYVFLDRVDGGKIGTTSGTDLKHQQEMKDDAEAFKSLPGVAGKLNAIAEFQNVPVQLVGKTAPSSSRWASLSELQTIGNSQAFNEGKMTYLQAIDVVSALRKANNAGDIWIGFAATEPVQLQDKQDSHQVDDSWDETVYAGYHEEQQYVFGIPWGKENMDDYKVVHHPGTRTVNDGPAYKVMTGNPQGYVFAIFMDGNCDLHIKYLVGTIDGKATWGDSVSDQVTTLLFSASM